MQPDIAVYMLDQSIQNLCVSADSPRVIPLPFDVQTGQVTISDDLTAPNVTRYRSYGYGVPDQTRLHYADAVWGGRRLKTNPHSSMIVDHTKNGMICPVRELVNVFRHLLVF